jgi:hypothetical protein
MFLSIQGHISEGGSCEIKFVDLEHPRRGVQQYKTLVKRSKVDLIVASDILSDLHSLCDNFGWGVNTMMKFSMVSNIPSISHVGDGNVGELQ